MKPAKRSRTSQKAVTGKPVTRKTAQKSAKPAKKIVISGIMAGRRGEQKPIVYNPLKRWFEVGGEKYAFRRDRTRNRLVLYKVVGGRIDWKRAVAVELIEVIGKKEVKLGKREIRGKRIRLKRIGLTRRPRKSRGKLKAPPRTILPLSLSYLTLKGATHACAMPFDTFMSYYRNLGYSFNRTMLIWERELPKIKR